MSSSALQVTTIETEQVTFDLLSKIMSDEIDASTIEIDFSSAKWASFDLKLTGKDFDSTINSDLMRAFVEYQNTWYRVAAYVSNGKLNAAALSDESREKLRLNFKVENGSSEFIADTVRARGEFANKATMGMGPKARLTIILSAMLLLTGAVTVPGWIDKHYKALEAETASKQHKDDMDVVRAALSSQAEAMKQLTENQKIIAQAIVQQPKLLEIRIQAENATGEIMRQAADADSVRYHGVTLPGSAVRTLTGRKRRSGTDELLEGQFRVEAADSTGQKGFICKVKRLSDGIVVQATMIDTLMSANDQEVIQQAFWSKKVVKLSLTARKVGNDYRGARITAAETVEASKD